jgi:hypothetical protein
MCPGEKAPSPSAVVTYDRPVILRCTKNLLAVLGPHRIDGALAGPDGEDWYANLLRWDRRKCLLVTHAATLFTAVQADVHASDLRATQQLVVGIVERELASEGLPADVFGSLSATTLRIGKTADRSVVGCMNDMAFRCETTIAGHGGLANTDLTALNRTLRRNINSATGYQRPIDLTTARLDAPTL